MTANFIGESATEGCVERCKAGDLIKKTESRKPAGDVHVDFLCWLTKILNAIDVLKECHLNKHRPVDSRTTKVFVITGFISS